MARNVALFGRRELIAHRQFVEGVTATVPAYKVVDEVGNKEWVVDVYIGPAENVELNIVRDVPIPPYARQVIGEFGPRGGGSNAALAESRFAQASDLSNLTVQARRDAVGQSAQLGSQLTGLGLSADQLASADLNTVVRAILEQKGLDITKSGHNKQLAGGLAEGLGTLLGLFLTRNKGGSES